MSRSTLTVTDNRTGESFEIPIEHGAIRASELTSRFDGSSGPGLVVYDPGFGHTAACMSAITNIHLEPGVLEHRGYRIEDLCEHSNFVEMAYLLIRGELPTAEELRRWERELSVRKFVHENVKGFIQGFRYDAQPMAMLGAAVGALGSFYPDADEVLDEAAREFQILRLLAKMPTLAALAYRHGTGRPFVLPSDELSYVGNLLSMLFRMSELAYEVDPRTERALEVLLMLHADHEQNASTTAVRAVGSTHVNPYAAIAAGVAALSGPMRGGAAMAVLRMLRQIERPENVAPYLDRVKEGSERLPGFGHWVYKAYDPRARILRRQLDSLYADREPDSLLAVADELAARAVEDEYFVSRRVFPNMDLYSGLTYEAIGIPTNMFGVMFAVARSAGWLAQWLEMVMDPEQGSVRPRQVYVGAEGREYVPLDRRT
jgi:citrate synthase